MSVDPPRRLTVATFNTRGCTGLDGWDAWPFRRGRLLARLRGLGGDVIACQEVLKPAHRAIVRALPGWKSALGPPSGRRVAVYNAIYWRAGAGLSAVRKGGFWLGETPDRRHAGWGSRTPRVAHWIEFDSPAGRWILLNVHLDHESPRARIEAAALVARRLAALGGPTVPCVVLGDFNANPDSAAHAAWTAGGLRDAWQSAGRADDAQAFTFHGFRGVRHPAETRIDWILHSPAVGIEAIEIIDGRVRGRFPSDHHPVRATVTLGGQKA